MASTTPKTLTPVEMLSLPRPGAGVANPAGDLAFLSVSQFSIKDDKTSKNIHLVSLDANTASANLAAGDAFWLDSRTLAHVVDNSGQQELYAVAIEYSEANGLKVNEGVLVGKLPEAAQASNFKYSEKGVLAFSAYVYEDHDLSKIKERNERRAQDKGTGMVFDSLFVRHWDQYAGPKRSALFATKLGKDSTGKWALDSTYHAPLKGTNHSVPVEPFGGAEDYDLYGTSLVYTTKDTDLNEAMHTRQNIYIVDALDGTARRHLTSGRQGATRSPVFSPDGNKIAWLELAEDGYESDEARVVIHDLRVETQYKLDFRQQGVAKETAKRWDRSPDGISFSLDGKYLVFTAGDNAHVKVFRSPIPSTPKTAVDSKRQLELISPIPVALTQEHASSSAQSLPNGRLLFTQNSLNGPNNLFVISGLESPNTSLKTEQITSFGAELLLKKELAPYEEFWFEGAEGKLVHGWAVKPHGWTANDKKATWPVLLLIHGGPQGAWEDQWSTRWNPQVFAQHGYFVLAINPTGSTTFGQSFVDAIKEDWGGKPMLDLSKGFHYALQTYPEIDSNRAVAAGASYGGYAVNWIAGHQKELNFNFRALVTHDGIFDSRVSGYTTEELFFWMHEFGGAPWTEHAIATAEKWNPSLSVAKFSSPHLIIHGSKDYRLPETDGLAMFTALQMRKVPSRMLIFPDENHWVLNPHNSLKWHSTVLDWLDQYSGKQ